MKVAVITLVVNGKKFLVETEDSGHRNHGKDPHGNLGKGNELGQIISFISLECFKERFTRLNTDKHRNISAF